MQFISLINSVTEKSRLAFCFLLAVTWLFTSWSYLRHGQGFMRLHLDLTAVNIPENSSIQVKAISVFGNEEAFTPTPNQPGGWSLKRFTGNIKEIQIFGKNLPAIADAKLTAGWEDAASPRIQIQPLTIAETTPQKEGTSGVLITRGRPASYIARFRQSLNWVGDYWFVSLTFLQALAIALATELAITILARLFLTNSASENLATTTALDFVPRQLILVITYGFGAILLIQIYHRLSLNLFEFRDPIQQTALALVQIGLIFGFQLCVRYCRGDRHAIYAWAIAILVLFSIKAIWLSQVSTLQCNDYGIYWEYGKAMAEAKWESINSQGPLALVLIRRSWAWCSWVAKLFGTTTASLELANFLLQLASAGIFSWYVKNRLGTAAMAASIIAFVAYPESWISATLASHDLPGIFWFVVLIVAVDKLCQRLTLPLSTTRSWSLFAVESISVGFVIAALDMQRDFGPFAIFALALMAMAWILLPPWGNWETWRRLGKTTIASCLIFGSIGVSNQLLHYQISAHFTKLDELSVLGIVTSVESRAQPYCDQMQPWRFLYYPAVPEEQRLQLSLSKLAHEKLVRLEEYRKQIFDNIKHLGFSGGLISFTFGGRSDSFEPNAPIPWSSFFYAVSAWIETFLGMLFLLRIAAYWKTGVYVAEIFPLIFCVGQSLAIILLSEVNPSYDSFLVVPFSLSAGVIVGIASRSQFASKSLTLYLNSLASNLTKTIVDNSLPLISSTSLIAIAIFANLPKQQVFCTPQSVIITQPQNAQLENISFDEDGIYITTKFNPDKTSEPPLPNNLTVEWNVNCQKDQNMYFFLAGNQRKLKLINTQLPEHNDQSKVELTIDGRVHFSGKITELGQPKWQTFTPLTNTARFTLTVHTTDELHIDSSPQGVSVEYFWQPN
jgi:hypothetical protein